VLQPPPGSADGKRAKLVLPASFLDGSGYVGGVGGVGGVGSHSSSGCSGLSSSGSSVSAWSGTRGANGVSGGIGGEGTRVYKARQTSFTSEDVTVADNT
jgi:hypothetical protein